MNATNYRVLVSDQLDEEGLAILRQTNIQLDYLPEISRSQLLEEIKHYDALLVRSRTKVDSTLIEASQKLKVIGRAGVGVDNIDLESATKRGVIVLNSPEGNINSVAELVIGLMITFSRNLIEAQESMFAGNWERKRLQGTELRKKTLGIVGLGKIGSLVAKLAKPFQLKLIAYDPLVSAEVARQASVELVPTLAEIWSRSDFISLHVPRVKQTENLVNADAFSQMKKSAVLINCARGGVVDEEALCHALEKDKIRGAALDVYRQEPLDFNSPLLQAKLKNKKLILLPHLGASTKEAQKSVAIETAKQVNEVLSGKLTPGIVNFTKINSEDFQLIREDLNLAKVLGLFSAQLIGSARPSEFRLTLQFQQSLDPINKKEEKELKEIKELEVLTLAALEGFLRSSVDAVNLVNSKTIATERGLKVIQAKSEGSLGREQEIILELKTNLKDFRVAGVVKNKHEIIITKINEFDFYLELGPYMLLTRHDDQPGVLAEIVKVLAEQEINISNLALGRVSGSNSAIMACSLGLSTANVFEDAFRQIKQISRLQKASLINLSSENLKA